MISPFKHERQRDDLTEDQLDFTIKMAEGELYSIKLDIERCHVPDQMWVHKDRLVFVEQLLVALRSKHESV